MKPGTGICVNKTVDPVPGCENYVSNNPIIPDVEHTDYYQEDYDNMYMKDMEYGLNAEGYYGPTRKPPVYQPYPQYSLYPHSPKYPQYPQYYDTEYPQSVDDVDYSDYDGDVPDPNAEYHDYSSTSESVDDKNTSSDLDSETSDDLQYDNSLDNEFESPDYDNSHYDDIPEKEVETLDYDDEEDEVDTEPAWYFSLEEEEEKVEDKPTIEPIEPISVTATKSKYYFRIPIYILGLTKGSRSETRKLCKFDTIQNFH